MIDLSTYVRPGSGVWWTQAGGEPTPLVHALLDQADDLGPVRAFVGISWDERLTTEPPAGLDVESYGALGDLRLLSKAGRLRIVPSHYSALPRLFAERRLPADVGIVQVSPPDADGLCSLGVTVDYAADAIAHTPVLIAEINEQMPATVGTPGIPVERFAATVHTDRPLLEAPATEPSPAERAIAAHIAGLVEDGDTIQLGIGRIPQAVLAALRDHERLGYHAGMVTPEVIDLIEAGVITGEHKEIDPGVAVTGSAQGDRRLYESLTGRAIEFRPVSYTHSPAVLSRLARFVAINSAIQVDLTGQVGAEVRSGVHVGALGGQVDFCRAAAITGRCSIIALRSTSRGESTIVPDLGTNPVTTGRADVDFVVTEHGVASLRGLSTEERARRMVAIAAPEHREDLERSLAGR
jgi:acyl-CoA hydrolase